MAEKDDNTRVIENGLGDPRLPLPDEVVINLDPNISKGNRGNSMVLFWLARSELNAIYTALNVRAARIEELKRMPEIKVIDNLTDRFRHKVYKILSTIDTAENAANAKRREDDGCN